MSLVTFAEILSEIDNLPATLEGLREFYGSDDAFWFVRAQELYPLAKQSLEEQAVVLEEGLESSPSKDLQFFRTIARIKPSGTELDKQLYDAIKADDLGFVELLLFEPTIEFDEYCGIKQACKYYPSHNGLAMIKLLLTDSRFDTSTIKAQCLGVAARYQDIELLDMLLQDAKVDPSRNHNHLIYHACLMGHKETVKRLLKDGRIDPGVYYNDSIIRAAERGFLEIVDMLLQDIRVNPTRLENKALHLARENGHEAVVERLLRDPRVFERDV